MNLNELLQIGMNPVPLKSVKFTQSFARPGTMQDVVTSLSYSPPSKDRPRSRLDAPVDLYFYPETSIVEVQHRGHTKLVSPGGWQNIELDNDRIKKWIDKDEATEARAAAR